MSPTTASGRGQRERGDSGTSESAKNPSAYSEKKKKILQLGEIVFWIEHSIVLVFPFFSFFSCFFFEGVLFFPVPQLNVFFETNDDRR